MVLTEPDAGSDVGAGRTRAIEQPDGTWHIEGVKRFITSAEHDLADNIFHLVLARPEGHGPGTKGLSMFLVPKYLTGADGTLGERNGVFVTTVEHKMGLKASTTCEVTFGADQPAVGTLVGGVHDGIRQMFKVIEDARMMVGTKAIATLSTGYLNALDFARNRTQGADLTQMTDKTGAAGDDHPPPRRPPHADAAEGVRGGHAGARPLHGHAAGHAPGRGGAGTDRRGHRGPQRPAAAGGQGGRLRTVVRDAHPVAADSRRLRVPPGLPDRAVHQGREDRQPVRGDHRDPEPATCSSARSSGTTGRRSARCSTTIRDFAAAAGGNGRLKAERAALAEAAGHVEAMAGAMAAS